MIVRSPSPSRKQNPRRCALVAPGDLAADAELRELRGRVAPEVVVAERGEERRLAREPASRTAATPPPPAGLAPRVLRDDDVPAAREPARPRAKSIHSTCPTTANPHARESHTAAPARVSPHDGSRRADESGPSRGRRSSASTRRTGTRSTATSCGCSAGRPPRTRSRRRSSARCAAYEKLRHAEHLRAWAFTIATRVALDERRRERAACPSRSPCSPRRRAPGLRGDRASRRPNSPAPSARRSCFATATTSSYADIAQALDSSEDAARQAASSGDPPAAQRGERMTVPTATRRPLPLGRPPSRDCWTSPTTSPTRPIGPLLVAATERGPVPDLVRPGARAEALDDARPHVRHARPALAEAARPDPPRARRLLRGAAATFDLPVDLTAATVPAARPRGARPGAVRRDGHVRRPRARSRQAAAPPARSAARSTATRSRSSCRATASSARHGEPGRLRRRPRAQGRAARAREGRACPGLSAAGAGRCARCRGSCAPRSCRSSRSPCSPAAAADDPATTTAAPTATVRAGRESLVIQTDGGHGRRARGDRRHRVRARAGLMNRTSLPEDDGMFFVFPASRTDVGVLDEGHADPALGRVRGRGRARSSTILDMEPCKADPCRCTTRARRT